MAEPTQDIKDTSSPVEGWSAFVRSAQCPDCGLSEYEGALFCSNCGSSLFNDVSERNGGSSPGKHGRGSHQFGPVIGAEQVSLVVANSGRRLTFPLDADIHIGRALPEADEQPELNLIEDGATEHGVSQLHARIKSTEWGVVLEDLGSANGTLLNNCRLPKELPYPLQNGDKIRFGPILVQVFFD